MRRIIMPAQQHIPYLHQSQSWAYRIAKRKDENPNLVKKLFDSNATILRNKEAFLASRHFVELLCSLIDDYKVQKIKELNGFIKPNKILDSTVFTDTNMDAIYSLEHEHKLVISQYDKSLAALKSLHHEIFSTADVKELQQKEAVFNPIKFMQVLNISKRILTDNVFVPLQHIKTESSFIHSLKMVLSNFAEKLGFGKKGYHFFQPKPVIHSEVHNIVENTRNIECAVKEHLGIV